MRILFAGSGDNDHQQQTERYTAQVELSAAIVLRGAPGWGLERAEVRDCHIYATFRREWGSGAASA